MRISRNDSITCVDQMNEARRSKWDVARVPCVVLAVIAQVAVFGMVLYAAPKFAAMYDEMLEGIGLPWCTALALRTPGWGYWMAMLLAVGVVMGKERIVHTAKASVVSSIACVGAGVLVFLGIAVAVMAPCFRLYEGMG